MRARLVGVIAVLVAAVLCMRGTGIAATEFTKEQIKAVIEDYITAKVKEGGGAFKFRDDRTGEEVLLEFVQLRFIRGISGHGYIGSMDFRAQNEPDKPYDLDAWVKPQDGRLVIMDVKAHRYPVKDGNTWVLHTVSPLPWWWAVAQEHPGDPDEIKGWVVKSGIHEYVSRKINEGGGVFKYTDEKTGKPLELEFVTIHDPVTKTKQGYFACSDFRVKGEPEKVYDLDFWLNEQGQDLVVTKTRIHKEPAKEGEKWVKKPRYRFEDGTPVEIQ